ncbi:MAG: efflux RND transporter periplasmic adaptor subunit, partial [Eubacteriales bacterium]|nr:efflux RND transporter periplasmic adaptor subunit [Eubacteriales bacterium]
TILEKELFALIKKLICIILSAMTILSFAGCTKEETKQTGTDSNVINVTVATVKARNITDGVTYPGELKASEDASVSSKISAKVTGVNVKLGEYVKAGTVLATLDGTDYRNAYNQAQAAYNSAVAAYENVAEGSSKQSEISVNQSLNMAQTNYDNALDNYNRQKQLFDIGAISQVALDSYKTQLDTAKLNLETAQRTHELTVGVTAPGSVKSAKAAVESASAALNTASSNLSNSSIVAPISGYVASSNIKLGQMATPGVELFAIMNYNSVDAEVSVTESAIPYITIGSKAKINVKSAGMENIEALVSVVNPVKNAKTGMYTVKVSIPNKNGKLMVGMMADITLTTDSVKNALSVLSDAILEDDEGNSYVYVVEGNKAKRRDINTGVSNSKYTQVISGLSDGEKVVVTGKEYISDVNNVIKITSK